MNLIESCLHAARAQPRRVVFPDAVDRRAIDGVEIYGGVEVQQGAYRRLAALEAAMGYGDAVAKTGGTQFFTGNKALENILHFETRHFAADQVGNLFEGFFLAAARRIHK